VARIGAFLISGALIAPACLSSVTAQASSTGVVTPLEPAIEAPVADAALSAPFGPELPPHGALATLLLEDAPALPPPPEPLVTDGSVLASWYGPGFYGHRTACGQTFSEDILGVAHRTLACGTWVRITSPSGLSFTVPVIDRGPFVAGRSLDLSFALKTALSCTDLCSVRIFVIDR